MLKAVIPAAGLGTRLLPVTKAIPKELFPLGTKPVIQYIVEEAIEAGMEEVIIILHKDKELIRSYFEDLSYEEELKKSGKEALLQSLKEIKKRAKLRFVYQEKRGGLGAAVYLAKPFIDDFMLVMLGDSVIHSQVPSAEQLRQLHVEYGGSVINLEKIPPGDCVRRGMVDGVQVRPGLFKMTDFVEKPKTFHTDMGVSGRYLLSKNVFSELESVQKGYGGELQLTDAIKRLLKKEEILAYFTEGKRFDIGSPDTYLEAIKAFMEQK